MPSFTDFKILPFVVYNNNAESNEGRLMILFPPRQKNNAHTKLLRERERIFHGCQYRGKSVTTVENTNSYVCLGRGGPSSFRVGLLVPELIGPE